MKQLSFVQWAVFGIGLAVLILCFFMYGTSLPENVFWLDLTVSAIAYTVLAYRALRPMLNLNDPAGREVGFLGASYLVAGLYALFAALAMFGLHHEEVEFKSQLIVQIILIFLLILGLMAGSEVSAKTVEVYNKEVRLTNHLEALQREFRQLDRTIALSEGIPQPVARSVAGLKEQIRYLSPSNSREAADLEQEMIQKTARLNSLCSDYESNSQAIERALKELGHIIAERKSIYSN
ncbi:MAG: hypothetical protein K2I26_00655 [Paramuribaculum sp.]|nr:hypothetical protein [Paramuribaculum sp.]